MPSQLECRPDRRHPDEVLQLTGTLDLGTGDTLRSAVLDSLATQPTRLLLDASRLHIGNPLGLAALQAALSHNDDWPQVPLVLCGASPTAKSTIAAACTGPSFAPGVETALTLNPPAPPRVRALLRPVPDACRQVREMVAAACERWQRADLIAVAALIATELVANVVRHAHTVMEFTFGVREDGLTMSVRDGSRSLPRPVNAAVSSPGVRGLWLVRDLSTAWGVLPVTDGKVVWTVLGA